MALTGKAYEPNIILKKKILTGQRTTQATTANHSQDFRKWRFPVVLNFHRECWNPVKKHSKALVSRFGVLRSFKANSYRIFGRPWSSRNKKRRFKKPWWTDELSQQWNNMCSAEKDWRKESGRRKSELKAIYSCYLSLRKHFNQTVHRTKMQYWFKCNWISIIWKKK